MTLLAGSAADAQVPNLGAKRRDRSCARGFVFGVVVTLILVRHRATSQVPVAPGDVPA